MRKLFINSLVVSSVMVSSLVACTNKAKERGLKGAEVSVDDAKKAAEKAAAEKAAAAKEAADKAIAGVNQSLISMGVQSSPGFLAVDSAPEKIKALKSAIVRISVPDYNLNNSEEIDAAKLASDNQLKAKDVKDLLAQLSELTKKIDISTTEGLKDYSQKMSYLLQLDNCNETDLEKCILFTGSVTQTGFVVEGDKIITTADFLDAYVNTILVNNSEYKSLSLTDKLAYLKSDKKLSIAIYSENPSKNLSSYGNLTVQLEDIPAKTFEAIQSATFKTDKTINVSAIENKVVLKFAKASGIKPIAMSKTKCADLKLSPLSILGKAMETTVDRVGQNKLNPKLGDAVKGTYMVSQGVNVLMTEALIKAVVPNVEDLAATSAKIIATNADSVSGFIGAPILTDDGEYVGMHTQRIEAAQGATLAVGVCLAK